MKALFMLLLTIGLFAPIAAAGDGGYLIPASAGVLSSVAPSPDNGTAPIPERPDQIRALVREPAGNASASALPPDPPTLVAPENGAIDLPVSGSLVWNRAPGAEEYEVYLGQNQNQLVLYGTVPDPGTEFEYDAYVTSGRTYYWQIVAKNPDGTAESETWNFTTRTELTPGWVEMSSVPAPPSYGAVRDGGLVLDAGDLLYVVKGRKVSDFYSYDVTANSWTQLPSVPPGPSGRTPGKGAAGCVSGRFVYLVKGNKTSEFWRFDTDPGVFAWEQLRDVPLGSSNSKVNSGSDLVEMKAGTGQTPTYFYLLKGKRSDFMRFNPDDAVMDWELLPDAPPGSKPRWDKGSWLVAHRLRGDGIFHIYAHKARYHELWRFDAAAPAWETSPLPGMPLMGMTGRSKKARDGSCAALQDNALWALKGGNTCEFWRFDLDTQTWHESDTLPSFGSTGRKRRVKGGGDIAATRGALYALKGSKTRELWRYVPYEPGTAGPAAVADKPLAAAPSMELGPNPLTGGTVLLRARGIEAPKVRLSVFDPGGRRLFDRDLALSRSGTAGIDLRALGSGVYLVEMEAGGFRTTRKLVVQR